MEDLKQLQEYLAIDEDLMESDSLLPYLQKASKEYIERTTGKKYDETNPLFSLCSTLLVSHWYTNRTNETARSGAENTHSIKAMLYTIKYDLDLEEVPSRDL